jgi:hypothetical protein
MTDSKFNAGSQKNKNEDYTSSSMYNDDDNVDNVVSKSVVFHVRSTAIEAAAN